MTFKTPRPLAIFDIDGTLIDSRHMITQSMQTAFTACGYDRPDYDKVRSIVGLSLDVAIERIAPKGLGSSELGALVESYKTAFVHLYETQKVEEPLYAGAVDMLQSLKDEGWLVGVATGKSRRGLDRVIKTHNFEPVFDCHFCADDGPGKPEPYMVTTNLMALDVAPAHALIIGDTSFDMLMGKRAGVRAVGVDWGFHTKDEIQAGGADVIISSMIELRDYLRHFAHMQAA